jgi:dienelactone hydrolase
MRAIVPRLALVGLVLLAGCGGDPAPAPRATPAPAARATTTPTPTPPHHILRFRASDGRRLHGELTPAERRHAPAVVLVHGLYGEPGQWDDFVGHLHRGGFATLAYASRSDHEPDEGVLARDLTGAVRALRARPEVDPDRIVLAGASVGGSTVAYALGTQPNLPARGGVGFSALEGPREVALAKRHAFRPHDLLLISDHREAQNARDLRADAHGKGITTYVAETTGHGVELLPDASVRARAIAWLQRLTSINPRR